MVDLINKKKYGGSLTADEIDFIVKGYTSGDIPDYQMSAFLMAVYFNGMNKEEIANLTLSFVNSGERVDLSCIKGIKVDKHSSGGVGDKLTLIIIPLAALAGVPVVKMSGRGLGHTGGTIDKLESIEGFRTDLTFQELISNVEKYNMAIVGQSSNLTPADKKIYTLRDVTGTVDSIPLIASSIMSKKIAAGADCIVLDVKAGRGAFMKTVEEARLLARTMVGIGQSLGIKTVAVISNMNQPLGCEVGNANEVKEAIEVLRGNGPQDVKETAITIASHMAVLGGIYKDFNIAYKNLKDFIATGKALEKFRELVKIQGGNTKVIDNPEVLLPQAKFHIEVKSSHKGYVNSIDAEKIGLAAMLLGAGRKVKEDKIDYAAGITLMKKTGDKVCEGETLCVLHTNYNDAREAISIVEEAYSIGCEVPEQEKYIYETISSDE